MFGIRYSTRVRCVLLVLSVMAAYGGATCAGETEITVTSRYKAYLRQPENIKEFLRSYPNVHIRNWEGLPLPNGQESASIAMAMAANMGPDIFESDIRQAVSQGLAYPLTEWIGEDGVLKNGKLKLKNDGTRDLNGQIDADEAKWDGWMKIKPLFRQIITVDGKPYGLPLYSGVIVGIVYSKRLVRKAGLDPTKPPQTWEDFIRWCRLLYNRKTKVPGFELQSNGWAFAPWVATTGSSIVVQERRSPSTGKLYSFNEQDVLLRAPDTGEDLSGIKPEWKCNIASSRCVEAIKFFHRLRWAPWIYDSKTGEPLELSAQELKQGYTVFRGRRVTFERSDIIEGCVSVTPPTRQITESVRRLGRNLAMYPLWAGDMSEIAIWGLQPSDMGMFPFPGMTARHKPVIQSSNCFFMIGSGVLKRGGATPEERKRYRNLVWQILTLVSSPDGSNEDIRRQVAAGQAKFLNPRDLNRLGLTDYIKEIPPENLAMWRQLDSGEVQEVVEPFAGRWLQFSDFLRREIIDLVLRPSGKDFDYVSSLKRLETEANSGVMFERPAAQLNQYRPAARIIAVLILAAFGMFLFLIIRGQMGRSASLSGVHKGWLPWIMLVPAVGLIAVWGYYPLCRGLVMAFQDYKIVGHSRYVGLSNFIAIALDANFYHYVLTTFRFVLWNLALAFFAPILLALLLAEVPRLKVFFRTLFFLPQMTSGVVVLLMWKDMFDGSPNGTLNHLLTSLLGRLGFIPVDWLGNPSTVMACVIVPGIWAGAGIGSLIYLAALKSVPDEMYEAASIDGAGIFRRIRSITIPTILPLVIINFVGAFIGTFQALGNIFLLTFGGPGKETMVLGMAIWQEAYLNLRFSTATSYAWILGSILIGFTYLQLRILRNVDFRQARGD